MTRQRRAMTLIEVIIALGIAFILSMVVFQVVVPSFGLVQEGQIKTELQQQGQFTIDRVAQDLQNTVPTGVSLAFPAAAGEGMIVATHPISPVLGAGILEFTQELLVVYHDEPAKRVWRKRFRNGMQPTGLTLSFTPFVALQTSKGNLQQICIATNGSEKSYALSVKTFMVEKEPTTGGEVYAIRMGLEKSIPGKKNRKATVELFRKVMLRNHI